ncbi:hypothetical protein [Streptoalloteichus hindustanus]|uniref:Uncharacterized protein n=1 Tax=Streptoalloteichus hindustanus TaxID=2017 RepID=A0A1M5CQ55_STRHI|nr:hypothetical protein [Streptoalloteichus hindustanus]SHF56823.1 hypothetical protein SAMN05444320_104119 [Streptoalloteichus hindustanus]
MADETVLWTALPNGVTGDPAARRLRISVFVSPRLVAEGRGPTLAGFPDFLDWPARLRPGAVAFSVRARASADEPPGQSVLATVTSPPPDSALWRALFDASTPVEAHTTEKMSARPLSTYSAARLHDQLKQGHQALAQQSLVGRPTFSALGATMGLTAAFTAMGDAEPVVPTLAAPEDMGPERIRTVLNRLAGNMFRADDDTDVPRRVAVAISQARALATLTPDEPVHVLPAVEDAPAAELARLTAFNQGQVVPQGAPPPPAPVFDFHRCLTLLSDDAALLRLLGLVIDLEVPMGAVPPSPSDEPVAHQLQVLPAFTEPIRGDSLSPFTAYVLEGNHHGFFAAAPHPERREIVHGLLDVRSDGEFALIQTDVYGSGLKLVNSLSRAPGADPDGDADEGGVPTVRTSGVSIVRDNHANRVWDGLRTATDNNATLAEGSAPALFAEDLVRGYRVDVLDAQAGAWRSLHQRVGTYVFRRHEGGPKTLVIHDEGVVQQAVTEPVGADGRPDANSELYVHDSLAHWQGWSLAAPRPGRTITDEGVERLVNTAPEEMPQLDVSFRAEPGSLPRLRFGHRYRFRARAVDLAGNGLGLAEATELFELFPLLGLDLPVLPLDEEDFVYRRFEPVLSPVLVPRERFVEGESLERLVIRSRPGASAAEEADELTGLVRDARPEAAAHYSATAERHVVPPKTAQLTAETHGMFDASFGSGGDPRQTYRIARKEKGRLTDTAVVDVTSGELAPVADPAAIQTIPTASTGEGYVVHREPRLELPYLPDPLARGAALFGLPGVPEDRPSGVLDQAGRLTFVASAIPADDIAALGGSVVRIGFGEQWPNRLPFRLVLAEPPADQVGDAPPAWDPQARVLTVFLAPAQQRAFRLSSFLAVKDLDQLGQWRWLLETDPDHQVPPGTLEVALAGGSWQLTPSRVISLVHAVEQPLLTPELQDIGVTRFPDLTACFVGAQVPVDGDSTVKVDVFASWLEAVDPPGAPPVPCQAHVFDIPIPLPGEPGGEPPNLDEVEVVPLATYDHDSSQLTLHAPHPEDQSGREFLSRHEFGDTRARVVQYQVTASTRFRECFPPEVTRQPERITRTGEAVEVVVPSSARPAAPRVVSVLPTFSWTRDTAPDGARVSHRTGGLRVYLERPWFSSGDGELLAVVLVDPVHYPPDDRTAAFVTHWGGDPLWVDFGLGAPEPMAFSNAVVIEPLTTLEEEPGLSVIAVGHVVRHDPDADRDLLYCDIAFDTLPDVTYFPFVRLALARYQPQSLPGVELSRVVLADFAQVPPTREVRLRPLPGDPNLFQLVVDGAPPESVPRPGLPVRVDVERRIPGTQDELGWAPLPEDTPGVEVALSPRWDWRACGGCGGVTFVGDGASGPCTVGGSHRPRKRQAFALEPAAEPPAGDTWRRCSQCQILVHARNPGVCSAGGEHVPVEGEVYALTRIPTLDPWTGWRRCARCHSLVFGGPIPGPVAANGPCPASFGGPHDHSGSADYVLDRDPSAPGQPGAVLCVACQGLVFTSDSPGPCPDGGGHVLDTLEMNLPVVSGPDTAGERGWRFCGKCTTLVRPDNTPAPCAAGEDHEPVTDVEHALTVLPHVVGAAGARRCARCECLVLDEAATCPSGEAHDVTASGDFVLPMNPAPPQPGIRPTIPLWSGTVRLPADRQPDHHRIVIRELEPLPTDDTPDPTTGRVVFAETFVV